MASLSQHWALSLLWGPREPAAAFWVGNPERQGSGQIRVENGDLSPPLRSWNLRG